MVDYIPLKGNSYIELPKELRGKQAIINMKNTKYNECFKWAVTRALHPKVENPQRIDKDLRERANDLNWNGIEFPVSVSYTHLRAHETGRNLVCRLLLEKKKDI